MGERLADGWYAMSDGKWGYFQCDSSGLSFLQPVLFYVFINDLDAGVKRISRQCADDTKLGGAVESLEGGEAVQRDLDRLETWAIAKCVPLNKRECQILKRGWGNPGWVQTRRREAQKQPR